MIKLLVLFSMFFSLNVFAGEHPLTRITGTDIDLKMADHAIAGSIKDGIVFGNKFEGQFRSKLIIKKSGRMIESIFAVNDSSVGGTIEENTGESTKRTTIHLTKMDKKNKRLIFEINGQEAIVNINADQYVNNHFINPSYSLEFNGEKIEFSVESGQACYGFSSHLSFMIIGAYIHQ